MALDAFYNVCHSLSELLWSEKFWLPFNLSWEDVKPTPENGFPDFWDALLYPILVAAFLLILKSFFIKTFFFNPLARHYNLKLKRSKPPPENKDLDKLFDAYQGKVPGDVIVIASKALNVSEKEVALWLYQKYKSMKPTRGEKFTETGFVFTFHTFYGLMGFLVLYNKHWFWDIAYCYKDYPAAVEEDIWWYYMIGLGFYFSQTVYQPNQPPHSNQKSVYIHHLSTIILLMFSWTTNFVRIGSIVFFIHEAVECFLQLAKLAQYAGNQLATAVLFAMTLFVWISTRLYLFTFWAIRSAIVEAPKVSFMPAAYVFYGFLFVLLGLNLMWTGTFISVIYRAINQGGHLSDVRSSGEESEEDNQTTPTNKKVL